MKTKLLILILAIFLEGCNESPKKDIYNPDKTQNELIYSLLNDFIIDSLFKADSIIDELMPINAKIDSNGPPPIVGGADYDSLFFETLLKSKFIDSSDLSIFHAIINQEKQLYWNPSKLKIKTFDKNIIYKNAFDPNFKHYEMSENFIVLSFPLFTKNNETILTTVTYICGGTCGSIDTYLFKRVNNKWTILFNRHEGNF